MTVSHTSISSIWSIEGTIRLGEIESMLSCFLSPWLLCAFDIRGYEACMRVHCSHLIVKWSRRSLIHFTWLGGCSVYGDGENGASETGFSYSIRASTEHRRRADSKRRVGGSEVGVHLEIWLELGVTYIKLNYSSRPKHSTESGTLFS